MASYEIPYALPEDLTVKNSLLPEQVHLSDNCYLCGDHLLNGSINAAMVSARIAVTAILDSPPFNFRKKSYIKKTLAGTSLASAEDFTSLAILMTHSSLSKTELLQLNLLEKTSGTEVINRLLANGLAIQWDDQSDRRTKRIAITEKGRQLLYPLFSDMGNVGNLITGKLSLPEKITLQYLLQQLENFHYLCTKLLCAAFRLSYK
ncbi:MAG: hypothetical protein EOO91_13790 [Pedobacter sp.]|nr:MAG: hypothetical protein EOO91_13790 [Pedobacter sp.]